MKLYKEMKGNETLIQLSVELARKTELIVSGHGSVFALAECITLVEAIRDSGTKKPVNRPIDLFTTASPFELRKIENISDMEKGIKGIYDRTEDFDLL